MPKSTMTIEVNQTGERIAVDIEEDDNRPQSSSFEPGFPWLMAGTVAQFEKENPEVNENVDSILRKYTYADLAKKCDPPLSRRHVSRVLKGQCANPSIAVMRNLANALSISVDDLEDELSKVRGPEIYKGGEKVTKEVEQQIRELKDKEGMTTRAAAELTGVSRMTVSMIWNSKEDKLE